MAVIMALTKNQIRDRVASDYLGILQLDQDLQHQDNTRISQAYDEVYEYLKTKGLATWSSTASVPNSLVPYMVALVAKNCYSTYGLSQERQARIISDSSIAESKIRELVSNIGVLATDATSY